jgi:hypothetical protein
MPFMPLGFFIGKWTLVELEVSLSTRNKGKVFGERNLTE